MFLILQADSLIPVVFLFDLSSASNRYDQSSSLIFSWTWISMYHHLIYIYHSLVLQKKGFDLKTTLN